MNWISVKDRLPEDMGYVFVYCPGLFDGLIMGYYAGYQYKCWNMKGHGSPELSEKLKSVTHWMPLPDKPAEEG